MPPEIFPQMPEDITGLTDEQIQELIDGFNVAFGRVATGEAFADMGEDAPDRNARREMLATARDHLKSLKAALDERHAEDEAWDADVAEIAAEAGVELAADASGEGAGEGDAGEGDEGSESGGSDESADVDVTVNTGGESAGETAESEGEDENGEDGVQASGERQYRHRPPATPRRHQPLEVAAGVSLRASAGVPGISTGTELDREALAHLTAEAIRSGVSSPPGMPFKMRLATANWADQYPEERRLDDADAYSNARKLEGIRGPRALAAAGGWCAPSVIRYDVGTLGVTERPVRDNLTSFLATRGGVRYFVDLSIAETDTTDGITRLTEAQDEGGTTTKDCVVVECPTDTEVRADVIASCLQAGNLASIAFPELIAAWQDLLGVATARNADGGLLDAISADPQTKTVTADGWYGSFTSIVRAFTQLAAGYRSRHRLGASDPLQALAPAWLADQVVIDLASMQFQTLEAARAGVAALIERFTGVKVEWYLDSEAGLADSQIFGAQGDGDPILGFPSPAIVYLYPPGGILFVDQGNLNIGLVRDSALNETNDVRFFSEFFENAGVLATEVFKMELTLCHNGTRAPAGTLEVC